MKVWSCWLVVLLYSPGVGRKQLASFQTRAEAKASLLEVAQNHHLRPGTLLGIIQAWEVIGDERETAQPAGPAMNTTPAGS